MSQEIRYNLTTIPTPDGKIRQELQLIANGQIDVYHHASEKHLGRYVDECTLVRLNSFIDTTAGRRITYKELTQ